MNARIHILKKYLINFQKESQVASATSLRVSSKCFCLVVGQVMSPHHSDQMSTNGHKYKGCSIRVFSEGGKESLKLRTKVMLVHFVFCLLSRILLNENSFPHRNPSKL